jgi:hypothetical protein
MLARRPAGHPAAAAARRGARGSRASTRWRDCFPPGRPLVSVPPFRAPTHTAFGRLDRRRRLVTASRRGEPSLTAACLFLTSWRSSLATRSRRCDSARGTARSRSPAWWEDRLPGAFQPRRRPLNPLSVRRARDPAGRVLLLASRLAAYRDKLSRALLGLASTSSSRSATACPGARGRRRLSPRRQCGAESDRGRARARGGKAAAAVARR